MDNNQNTETTKRRFRPIHIIIIVLVLVISFASVFLIGRVMNASENEGESATLGPAYTTSEFTVNLANTNGRRYLKAQFTLEVDHKRVLRELENKRPMLQDTVITILSHQLISDLESLEGKEKLKIELQDNINSFLVSGEVVNIYYNHFVWQ